MSAPPTDILVTLDHPHGALEVPLAQWAKHGPGERPLVRPIAARDARTGEALPLSVVPLALRNSWLSRSLIRLGVISNPWGPRAAS